MNRSLALAAIALLALAPDLPADPMDWLEERVGEIVLDRARERIRERFFPGEEPESAPVSGPAADTAASSGLFGAGPTDLAATSARAGEERGAADAAPGSSRAPEAGGIEWTLPPAEGGRGELGEDAGWGTWGAPIDEGGRGSTEPLPLPEDPRPGPSLFGQPAFD